MATEFAINVRIIIFCCGVDWRALLRQAFIHACAVNWMSEKKRKEILERRTEEDGVLQLRLCYSSDWCMHEEWLCLQNRP